MKRVRVSPILRFVLLAGAFCSGAEALVSHARLCAEWRATPVPGREELILGRYAPATKKVREQVGEGDGILLVSDMDPAPLPYALFPRRIWQMRTEPETSAAFMDLPPSRYPVRPPESLPVSWRLDLFEANAEAGGDLTRLSGAGTER